jgi:DNA polymerase-3 subunit gamma/tau
VTVLSRCLQFNLKQMPPAAIVSHLERILGEEKVDFEKAALSLIAAPRRAACATRSRSSTRRSRTAAAAVAAGRGGEMLGAIDQSYLVRLLECVAGDDASGAVSHRRRDADRAASRSTRRSPTWRACSCAWRFAQSLPGALDELGRARAPRALAGKLDPESLQLYYQIALQGREDLPLAPDEHGGFLMTVLRMLRFRPERPGQRHCCAGGASREVRLRLQKAAVRHVAVAAARARACGDRSGARARAQCRAAAPGEWRLRAGGAQGEGVSRRPRVRGQAEGRRSTSTLAPRCGSTCPWARSRA